jgi:hypothetical protein
MLVAKVEVMVARTETVLMEQAVPEVRWVEDQGETEEMERQVLVV